MLPDAREDFRCRPWTLSLPRNLESETRRLQGTLIPGFYWFCSNRSASSTVYLRIPHTSRHLGVYSGLTGFFHIFPVKEGLTHETADAGVVYSDRFYARETSQLRSRQPEPGPSIHRR